MKKELELKLVEKYPLIFRDYGGDMRKTCMHWGLACGDGWYDLLETLCKNLDSITKNKDVEVIADQVKEKFGGLRFYYHIVRDENMFDRLRERFWTFMVDHSWGRAYNRIMRFKRIFFKSTVEKIRDAIDHAEGQSYKTCEVCGKPGKSRGGGWVVTLCNECNNEHEKKK